MSARGSISLTSAAPGPLYFPGGRAIVGGIATFGGGSFSLEGVLPDGSTFGIVPDAAGNAVTFSAAGFKTVYLAPGMYKVAITTATAVICSVVAVD